MQELKVGRGSATRQTLPGRFVEWMPYVTCHEEPPNDLCLEGDGLVSDQYFIRIRGKVQGPFDVDKLRGLARRGQFSRMHEVSPDGLQWLAAKEYPELFGGGTSAEPRVSSESPGTVKARSPAPANATTGPKPDEWFYMQERQTFGPLEFSQLLTLISSKQLAGDTHVWREGMPDWSPAHLIPGLGTVASSPNASVAAEDSAGRSGTHDGEVSVSVLQPLRDSRNWVMFISVVGFVTAACIASLGILLLVVHFVAGGLSHILLACIISYGSLLLLRYASAMALVERTSRQEQLKGALAALRAFWAYLGIVLIVLLVLSMLAALIVIASMESAASFLEAIQHSMKGVRP